MLSYKMQYEYRRDTPSDIWAHLGYMHERACGYRNPVIIELGVRTGNSTAAWLAAVEEHGGHLYSVDVDRPRVPDGWFENPSWTLLITDDRSPDTVAMISAAVCPPGADVLFIDTSHEYQHTLDELDLYMPLLRPGGVALFHDTEWMTREVAKALDDWCPRHGLTWENHTGNNGLGEIRIPEANG